jgi:O-antigen/teichoic acid export membrane protein
MAGMAWRLADPIFIVIMPKLAKICSSDQTEKLTSFVKALLLVLIPSALLLFVTSVAGVALVGRFLLGKEYVEAVKLYPAASAWILIALPLIWTHPLSIASGKPSLFFVGGGLGNAVGLLAIVLGAWRFGVEGALIGLSLAFCLPFVFSFMILRRFGVIRW